jgi:hypothetical protein
MQHLQKWFSKLAVAGTIAIGLSACASGGYYARGPIPPPPPNASVRFGVAPGAGYMWRDGYYNYNRGRYNWTGGGWVRPPRGRSVWVNPGWNGNRWRGGRWR